MMYLAVAINEPDNKLIAGLINLFTFSKAHHVEVVFSDGKALSARPGFVGMVERTYNYYDWVMIPLSMLGKENEEYIRTKAEELVATNPGYDYIGAISGLFGSPRNDSSRWFCGELCAKALEPYIPGLCSIMWATPEIVWKVVSTYVGDYKTE